MIQIKNTESKSLTFDIVVEGIDNNKLKFVFRIEKDGVEYGFPGILENNKVKITIPVLSSIFETNNGDILPARLEVLGDQKFYLKPWEDSLSILVEPRIAATTEASKEEIKENIAIKAVLTATKSTEPVITEKKKVDKKKTTKLGALLQK